MLRHLSLALALLAALVAAPAQGQEIQRGKLKQLDADKKQIVVTQDGKDLELTLTDETRVFDATGNTLAEKLKDFKAGADIFFAVRAQDGKQIVQGIKLAAPGEGGPRPGGGGPNRGKVKSVDADAKTITLTVGDKDVQLEITERSDLRGARGESLADKLKTYPVGADVLFLAQERDGKQVLGGIMLASAAGGGGGGQGDGKPVSPEHGSLKPLDELGSEKYQGFVGGFYPDGQNQRPAAHEAAGLKLASQVQPLDADGKPSPEGKIVLLSIGMSNTAQSSQGFMDALNRYEARNPQMLFVNGAVGGMTAAAMRDANDGGRGTQYWAEVDNRLKQAGVTRAQVQAIWIKQANAGPRGGFPAYAQELQADLTKIVGIIAERFPNAKLCYLSGRTYGGYATTGLNPEPYAYESGFSVKWLIEEQLKDNPALNYDPAKGAVKSPWLSWGPNLWANGAKKRAADGFSYEPTDFAGDGTHHSPAGSRKVGQLLLEFFSKDSTTKGWFNK
jgi:Cu/Ag efflux protein CusF